MRDHFETLKAHSKKKKTIIKSKSIILRYIIYMPPDILDVQNSVKNARKFRSNPGWLIFEFSALQCEHSLFIATIYTFE